MVELIKINKYYGDKHVLKDIDLTLNNEVVALIGENGAGKTTLIKIISGEIESDSGRVILSNVTLGYVPQHPRYDGSIRKGFDQTTEQWRIEKSLQDVGLIKNTSFLASNLSGGQKTRLSIANVLSHDPAPNTLLLDEPTNNLDPESLKWLEHFINNFQGTVIIISHERGFINRTCSRVLELKDGILTSYNGNYDSYKQQKNLEQKVAIDSYELGLSEYHRIERIISSQRRQMHEVNNEKYDKIKHESKMQFNGLKSAAQYRTGRKIKALTTRLSQLEDIRKPDITKSYSTKIVGSTRLDKAILKLEDVTMEYEEVLFEHLDLFICNKDRVQIKGKNGSGKSTLLKIANRVIAPTNGKVVYGANATIGYLSQDTDNLDHEKTALANLEEITIDKTDIYRQSRALGLKQEDLKNKVKKLSRGQQAKLSFCKLLLARYDLLILDEPTNHLDIPTRENIESAIKDYKGGMLVASHDDKLIESIKITSSLNLDKVVPA